MKKGVSPVIATVILLTLTILLGVIILNSSMKFITDLSPPADCPGMAFEAGLYLENNNLILELNNIGNTNIAGMELVADNQQGTIDTKSFATATPIGKSSSTEILNFNIPSNARVTAHAQVIQNNELATCINGQVIPLTQIGS